MSRYNYFFNTPYSNPAGEIEKQTNELPTPIKSQTTTAKRTIKVEAKDEGKTEEIKVVRKKNTRPSIFKTLLKH